MKCLSAACLDSSSRKRTSEEEEQRLRLPAGQDLLAASTLTFAQRPLQVDQNLGGEDAA